MKDYIIGVICFSLACLSAYMVYSGDNETALMMGVIAGLTAMEIKKDDR